MVNNGSTSYGKEALLCEEYFCVLEASYVVCGGSRSVCIWKGRATATLLRMI